MATSILSSHHPFVNHKTLQQVSKLSILLFIATVTSVVSINAAFNLSYGASQGVTQWGVILTALAFASCDFVLLFLSYLFVPRWLGKLLGLLSMIGLVALSVFSATAFLIGQQYQKEAFDVQLLRQSIEDDRAAYRKYHKQVTADRIERKTNQLTTLVSKKGGDGATAIYHYIASATGYNYESVSLTIRIFWAFTYVLAGIALASILSEWGKEAVKQPVKAKPHSKKERSPTRDTRTKGTASSRYQDLRDKVRGGELKPSVSSLVSEGMTNRTAVKYLRSMAEEGVINRNRNGYHLP